MMMAVMSTQDPDVESDRPVVVRERLEAFGVEVLADAMNTGAAGERRVVSAWAVGAGAA